MSAAFFPSWDDVLAECEATAAHAEALLLARNHEHIRAMPPSLSVAELGADLGTPSAEVIRRARALQIRHIQLQAKLAQSMRDIEHQAQLSSDGAAALPRTPLYIDRKV